MLLQNIGYLLGLVACTATWAHGEQTKPLAQAAVALYEGKDREKILLDGVKKEG